MDGNRRYQERDSVDGVHSCPWSFCPLIPLEPGPSHNIAPTQEISSWSTMKGSGSSSLADGDSYPLGQGMNPHRHDQCPRLRRKTVLQTCLEETTMPCSGRRLPRTEEGRVTKTTCLYSLEVWPNLRLCGPLQCLKLSRGGRNQDAHDHHCQRQRAPIEHCMVPTRLGHRSNEAPSKGQPSSLKSPTARLYRSRDPDNSMKAATACPQGYKAEAFLMASLIQGRVFRERST